MTHMASVGIIGGADGPTAIFVTSSGWSAWAVPALAVLGIIGLWLFWRRKK